MVSSVNAAFSNLATIDGSKSSTGLLQPEHVRLLHDVRLTDIKPEGRASQIFFMHLLRNETTRSPSPTSNRFELSCSDRFRRDGKELAVRPAACSRVRRLASVRNRHMHRRTSINGAQRRLHALLSPTRNGADVPRQRSIHVEHHRERREISRYRPDLSLSQRALDLFCNEYRSSSSLQSARVCISVRTKYVRDSLICLNLRILVSSSLLLHQTSGLITSNQQGRQEKQE